MLFQQLNNLKENIALNIINFNMIFLKKMVLF